ncbi:phosphomannomutase/phosphoglucomutase [bacterium]|nr:phosphomannomutase/phosphoglucomutase [bacterium]
MKFDSSIFKAYDIRGIYPTSLDEEIAKLIGAGLVEYLQCREVVVGRDMRVSSSSLFSAICEGITSCGADVIDIGMVSTDGLYFAVGKYRIDAGIMITASHNPPEYNGFKICKKDAVPLSGTDGLPQIKRFVEKGVLLCGESKGKIISRNIDDEYANHCLSFIDVSKIKPFHVAIDAGNGMAGKTLPPVFERLPISVDRMFFDLDGNFPNHLASPIEPENTIELRARVAGDPKIQIGAAFDGDADRMFLIDEKGNLLGGDMVTALVAKSLLKKFPGESIVYNLICSRAVPELIEQMGGKAIRTKVGHSIIKPIMKKENAVFGGEHSGHFYFRDNWFADSGLIAFLVCLEVLSQADKPISDLIAEFDRYVRSGEINSKVNNREKVIANVKEYFASEGLNIDEFDGITISAKDWWVNLRPSNTEPLVRLNAEAKSKSELKRVVDETLAIVKG